MKDIDVLAESLRLRVLAVAEIEKARRRAGLTQQQLAERLGVPQSFVSKVLNNGSNITLETLGRFGLACGVYFKIRTVKTRPTSPTSPPS